MSPESVFIQGGTKSVAHPEVYRKREFITCEVFLFQFLSFRLQCPMCDNKPRLGVFFPRSLACQNDLSTNYGCTVYREMG